MSTVMQRDPFVVEQYASAARFLDDAGPWLAANEAQHNLVFGLAHLIASGDHPFQAPIFLAAVKEQGRIVGCAVRPPPDHLDLTAMPSGAAVALAAAAAEHCPDLQSLGGPPAAAREFARAWAARHGGNWRVIHHWSWFVLHEVQWPRPPPGGALRLAEDSDWLLVSEWAPLYVRDTGAQGSVMPFLQRRMSTRSLYLWDHGGPKCMVSISGHTPNGLRVSGVYTPDEHRKLGYASNAVATISQRALDEGRTHCVLFAESHHTATLRVYQKLGYELLHETVVVELTR
jgi:hypothetical protein